jgi:hypothetical protein
MKLHEVKPLQEAAKPRVVAHVHDVVDPKSRTLLNDIRRAVKEFFDAEIFSVEKEEFEKMSKEEKEALYHTIKTKMEK